MGPDAKGNVGYSGKGLLGRRQSDSKDLQYRRRQGRKRRYADRCIAAGTDASLLGLVYPSGVLKASDENVKKTVKAIINNNTTKDGGLLRYPGDKYCGGVRAGWVTLTGAGSWPLLSFWMSIYFSLLGDAEKANEFFDSPLGNLGEHIPEQIFADNVRQSITPLLWSHAMFVIAAKLLGHI